MPKSPYIDRLREGIAQAEDPAARGLRRAQLAAGYARLGEFDAAEEEISGLRAEFGDGRSGRVSIMIMCAEAQLIYYKNLGEKARDRMMRAQLLSVAGRDAELSAITSAWLAHICFNLHRHEEMTRSAKTCLDTISVQDHEAASRLALTLGDAFYAAEQPNVGNRWYSKAHEHAVKLGDHSTIGALTYNRAAMGTFIARLQSVDGPVDSAAISRLTGEVRTAVNYQAIAQLASLKALLDYSQASAAILAGQFSDAATILERMVADKPSTSPIERHIVLQCDLALSLAKSNQLDAAATLVRALSLDHLVKCTPDDQVVASSALASAAALCGLRDIQTAASDLLARAKQEHRAAVAALRQSLAAFGDAATIARL
ncbi:MAG: hypothetical protein JNL93_03405 [Pelomonas sp.]|nr:hypothetical protein [Roseateles sp.]